MGRWLKAIGLGESGRAPVSSRGPNSQRTARIRETMRWRGFDLTAYTDEEIAIAANLLGPAISHEGETTEESRNALADLLLQRRLDPEAIPATVPSAHPGEADDIGEAVTGEVADIVAEASVDEPLVVAAGAQVRVRRPGERATTLERLKHVFGTHTWHLVENDAGEGQGLRCYGCGMERATIPLASPLEFPSQMPEEGAEEGHDPDQVTRPDFHEARTSGSTKEEPEPRPSGPGQAFRLLVRSPWWVKLAAVFAIAQLAGFVAKLFGNA